MNRQTTNFTNTMRRSLSKGAMWVLTVWFVAACSDGGSLGEFAPISSLNQEVTMDGGGESVNEIAPMVRPAASKLALPAATVISGSQVSTNRHTVTPQPVKIPAPTAESARHLRAERAPETDLPRGKVLTPRRLFSGRGAMDKAILNAEPRLYLSKDFDTSQRPVLVVGLPGWGGRSDKFIHVLVGAFEGSELRRRVVVASIQDLASGGPRYQGQGDRAHANLWRVTTQTVARMGHFVERVNREFGPMTVVFFGFSTGGVAAPNFAAKVAAAAGSEASFRVEGGVALGTGTGVPASQVKRAGQRVMMMVVPKRLRGDDPQRDDQWNRQTAQKAHARLIEGGAQSTLLQLDTAKEHLDWHWGLVSQCRYFPADRQDDGRGYWPDYQRPNPQMVEALRAFVRGESPTLIPATDPGILQNCQ